MKSKQPVSPIERISTFFRNHHNAVIGTLVVIFAAFVSSVWAVRSSINEGSVLAAVAAQPFRVQPGDSVTCTDTDPQNSSTVGGLVRVTAAPPAEEGALAPVPRSTVKSDLCQRNPANQRKLSSYEYTCNPAVFPNAEPVSGADVLGNLQRRVPLWVEAGRVECPLGCARDRCKTQEDVQREARRNAPAPRLTVALVGTPLLPGIVLGGQNSVEALRLRFTAQNDGVQIRKMRFKVAPERTDDEVASVDLVWQGQDQQEHTANAFINASRIADFNNLDVVVPQNGSLEVVLRANIAAVGNDGSSGADSGSELQFDFDFDSNFEAVGRASDRRLTSVGLVDLKGEKMTVRKAKPAISVIPPNGVLSNGSNKEIFRFTVIAEGGDVAIKKFTFNTQVVDIAENDLRLDTFRIFDANNLQAPLDITGFEDGRGGDLSGQNGQIGAGRNTPIVVLANEFTVQPGNNKTFIVRARITGVASVGDTVSTRLSVANDITTRTNFLVGRELSPSNSILRLGTRADGIGVNTVADFIWSDISRVPHSDGADNNGGSQDWTSGRFVIINGGEITLSL